MTMQNTVTSADADWSGMSEDETVINCNALKPKLSRKFLEIVVRYPKFCTYPEYEGKPYYAIKYEEKGETIIGFGTYKPEVLSQYLRQYFLLFAEPELEIIRCENCKWWDRLEDGHPYGYCRACRNETYTERWEISIYRQNKYDFYCADAEPKENENDYE